MKVIYTIGILFLTLFTSYSQDKPKLVIKSLSYDVSPIIDINNCISWHLDMSKLKSTVLYKDHFISMGLYGGMITIDTNLTEVNKKYSNKLNSDLYTNLAVRHDTLFAEKFHKIYYLNISDTSWHIYTLTEPIVLFDILFEDDKYVFYPVSHGEFGTMLFIYDKVIRKLKYIQTGKDPKCIYYSDENYYVNTSLRHGCGYSSYFRLQNIEKIETISQNNPISFSFDSLVHHFRKIPVKDYPIKDLTSKFYLPTMFDTILPINSGIMLTCSFPIRDKLYHFTNYNTFGKKYSYDRTYISNINDKELVTIDSINFFHVSRAKTYGTYCILESNSSGNGFYVSDNNQLIHVKYTGTPNYHLKYDHNNVYINKTLVPDTVFNEQYTYKPNFIRELHCNLDTNFYISTKGNNINREAFIIYNNERKELKLSSISTSINKAFKYQNNYFLYFFRGNDYKYGLIEIYNLERFITEYSVDE